MVWSPPMLIIPPTLFNKSKAPFSICCIDLLLQGNPSGPIGLTKTVYRPSRLPANTSVKSLSPIMAVLFGSCLSSESTLFNALLDGDKNFVGDNEPEVSLPVANLGEEVIDDYSSLKLSLKSHPLSLLRNILSKGFYKPISVFTGLNDGDFVSVAGLVLVRQRPSTAKGGIFITIEDDTGVANLVIWSRQFERFKRAVMNAKLLGVTGKLQREGEVVHLIAQHLQDLTFYLSELPEQNQCQPVTSSNFINNAKIQMSKNTVQSAKNKKSDGKIARVNFNSRDFH